MNSENVNVVGVQGKAPRLHNSNVEEEAKYLEKDLACFWAMGLLKKLRTQGKGTKERNIMGIDVWNKVE